MTNWFVRLAGLGVVVFVACSMAAVAYADTLQSTTYRFEESAIGSGGLLQSTSSSYQVTELIGDTAIGNTASTNYQIDTGHVTTDDPALSFAILEPAVNFGSFTASGATVATSTFSVSNYTSYGYVVQIVGDTPSNDGHDIPAMASTGPSQAGIEQFGINLVANTLPVAVGDDPIHGLFAVGSAAPNYATANNFRFVSGETIVTAPKSSGVTTYTISYIVNVSSLTPGGQYDTNHVLICTGTY
jgi:hypothetical protein